MAKPKLNRGDLRRVQVRSNNCRLVSEGQERGVATRSRRVDRDGLLGSEPREVMRAAGLWAGARQALAAERLHADHRADLVAVDVDVAHLRPRHDPVDGLVDARPATA